MLAHVCHLRPGDVDALTVRDFLILCDWVDDYVKQASKGA